MHIPVLLKEVLDNLDPKPNENFVDGTIGEAGHAIEILKATCPNGILLGIDRDESQVKKSKQNLKEFKNRLILVNDSYANLAEIVKKENFGKVDGILLDLGMSSRHIEDSGRGFSFMRDEPLDMRYDSKDQNCVTAKEIINNYPEQEIEKIFREFGEERFSRQIANQIIKERQIKSIESTFELIEIIRDAIPAFAKNKSRELSIWAKAKIGAKTFQALRIAVNHELDNLRKFLPEAINILSGGGRLVIISFHSLEDRIVKNEFRDFEKAGIAKILTKKPVTAGMKEIVENPRSRSAKLRAIIKLT